VAYVRISCVLFLCCAALTAGCSKGSSDANLSADVFAAYNDPKNQPPSISGGMLDASRIRYERLAAALQAVGDKHAGTPGVERVRELQALCASAAEQLVSVAAKMKGNAVPLDWQYAQATIERFETEIRALPGAAEQLPERMGATGVPGPTKS
jgi:hypothetical protein